jgi:DNA (cytosine-5)-methyltransferase 1
MENVPQVHGKKNKADFDKWLDFLRNKGYQNFWQDLNAKDFGIPQNRERCFCVSILSKDFVDYEFPNEIKLNYKMKDLLEPVVDEKYYINSPRAKELIEKLIVEASVETVLLSNQGTKLEKKTDVATCLMARDYKGFGNQSMNGVVECVM